MLKLTQDERNYIDDKGVLYTRATTPLEFIPRKALCEWYAKTGLEAFDYVEEMKEIGNQVHYFIRLIENSYSISAQEWETIDPRVRNGIKNYLVAKETLKFKPKATELTVVSEKYGYAGTTDMVATINNKERYLNKDDLWLLDWKTGDLWIEVRLQLSAYFHAFEESTRQRLKGCRAIHLDRVEKWTPKDQLIMNRSELEEAFEIYLCTLKTWRYCNGQSNNH